MLTHFSVKNFRNFNDWTHFDLNSNKKYAFNENAVEHGIIKHAMVYGENGQGKTNLGVAICELTTHLSPASRADILGQGDNTNADNNSQVSEFIYQFIFNQQAVKYHYGKNHQQGIIFEILSINDEIILHWDKTQNNSADIELEGAQTLDKNLSDNINSIIIYVHNNAILTKTATNDTFIDFVKFAQKMIYLRSINQALSLIHI